MGAAMELWETLEQSIVHYTGLSPATFFTVLAVAMAFYYVVSGFFASPPPPPHTRREAEPEPLPPPVQLGEVTEEELKVYDGSDPSKPLLMAIKGQIYDVTQSRMFYGPGGPYALFAGKDASRALAKMSFEEKDLTGDISGLGSYELDSLNDWEYKFMGKYMKVGTIKKTVVPVVDATDANASETTETSTQTTERGIVEGQAEHVTERGTVVDATDADASETTETSTQTTERGIVEHVAELKEGNPPVTVAKEEENPADAGTEAEHIADSKAEDNDAGTNHVADAESKHVAEPKEVAVEDSAKE